MSKVEHNLVEVDDLSIILHTIKIKKWKYMCADCRWLIFLLILGVMSDEPGSSTATLEQLPTNLTDPRRDVAPRFGLCRGEESDTPKGFKIDWIGRLISYPISGQIVNIDL